MKSCMMCSNQFKPKRKEQKFCSKSCAAKSNGSKKSGKDGPRKNWIYSKRLNKDGYIMIYAGNHPYAEGRKMISEHVMKMELMIGRRIEKSECVHHKNGDKTDNRIENLELMSFSEHSSSHMKKIYLQKKRGKDGRFA